MSDKPVIVGVDFGSEDASILGICTRKGGKWIYTLAEGESVAATKYGFIVAHPDRPPKLVTSEGIKEIIL